MEESSAAERALVSWVNTTVTSNQTCRENGFNINQLLNEPRRLRADEAGADPSDAGRGRVLVMDLMV